LVRFVPHRTLPNWLDAFGKGRSFAYGRAACGGLLLVRAGLLIASA
jgi:hypothetical protein